MQAWLSYDSAPPLRLPLPFFLVAPVWLMATGATLLFMPADGATPYHPIALAVTHMLALGVLGNVMLGALLQILAVVSGVAYRRPAMLFHLVFWPLQAGTTALCSAFLLGFSPALFRLAGLCLGLALPICAAYCLGLLARSPARDVTTKGIAGALAGLIAAAGLGIAMTGVLGAGWPLPLLTLRDAHVVLATGGWLSLLIMAVSFTVIPMFQITPSYPLRWQRLSLAASWIALGVSVVAQARGGSPLAGVLAPALPLGTHAALTLRRLHRSRRPGDPGRLVWMVAMAAQLLGLACAAYGILRTDASPYWMAAGWATLAGLGLGAVLGMLYKIVPFLFWLHLKRHATSGTRPPSMHEILPERNLRIMASLHAAALLSGFAVLSGFAAPWIAGASLLLLGIRFGADMACATSRYHANRVGR
ncbi:hypothetical protein [Paludibacterium paludis]|uniref:Uncharacterized protein n=1 Tax=Paludibacterium paludis TaxID=1225769 RepID=A0A918UBV5_9NEIS|nr:hypothetical protein [Paludibacterium paludis]GGY25267.1 hypothetical protein GCM10011289_31040 [Paludibacterium paludis]